MRKYPLFKSEIIDCSFLQIGYLVWSSLFFISYTSTIFPSSTLIVVSPVIFPSSGSNVTLNTSLLGSDVVLEELDVEVEVLLDELFDELDELDDSLETCSCDEVVGLSLPHEVSPKVPSIASKTIIGVNLILTFFFFIFKF